MYPTNPQDNTKTDVDKKNKYTQLQRTSKTTSTKAIRFTHVFSPYFPTMSNENNTGKEGSDKKRRKGSIFGGTPIDGCADEKYVLPKVWKWDHPDPESNNKPTAGHRFKGDLPVGKHPLQLYSMATQNGQKVTIMLEELLESGFKGAEYDAWLINIMNKEQFSSGFVDINPNSKIPALVDRSTATKEGDGNDSTNSGGYGHIKVFESGSILLYLAEKFDNAFLPTDPMKRVKTMNWFFWNVGSSPLGTFLSYDDCNE